jgi:hypothetical protein
VVGRAAAQVTADRHANDHRARKGVARPVAQHRNLVADLHHRRPDVVEKLDLDDRLDAADGHAECTPHDVGLGQRRIEDAHAAELALQPVGHFEHAALARDFAQMIFAAAVGDILAEDDDARVVRHLVAQRPVDRGHHRVRFALTLDRRIERIGRRIDVR